MVRSKNFVAETCVQRACFKQNIHMKKTIFFDFDGVIADSFGIAFAVSKMKRPTLTLESYKEKWKANISKAVFTEPESETVVDFHKEFANKMGHLKLTPAKKKVLQDLSERFDFHVISSTRTRTIELFCEANQIYHYFGDILGYDIETSKVKKFQTLLEKYKLDPKEVVFITDTVGDIEEAKEIGIGTIVAVADGYQDREVLTEAHPTFVIDSIVNLEEVI
jgi:HAD superfamily hydrolase (TIGR01509 family)